MREANLKDFKKGTKKVTAATPVGFKSTVRSALIVPEAFGGAVEGVRAAGITKASDLRDSKKTALVGAAGSTGLLASTATAVGRAGKDITDTLPKPVKAVVVPVGAFAAGVALPILAIRYAPGAAASAGVKVATGGAKALTPGVPSLGRDERRSKRNGKTAGSTAGAGDAAAKDAKSRKGKSRKAGGAAKASRRKGQSNRGIRRKTAPSKPRSSDVRGAGGGKASSRRNSNSGAHRGGSRRRGSRRGRGSAVRGVTKAQEEILHEIEAQGWDVSLSPSG